MKSIISENLIKNGHFNGGEYWVINPGVTFDENKAVIAPHSAIAQDFVLAPKSIYRIVFTISEPTVAGKVGNMVFFSWPRPGHNLGGGELINLPLTGAKTYEVEGELAEHDQVPYFVNLGFLSAFDDNAGFKVEDVQFYLIDEKSPAPQPDQLLLNGDFSSGLAHWEHSDKVIAEDGKAFLSGSSSIEQSLRHPEGRSFTLKFDISDIKGTGTASIYYGLEKLSFDSPGSYVLEFRTDSSASHLTVGFATDGSFKVDNVVLFVTPE